MYLRSVSLRREEVASFDVYPYSIPAIRALHRLELDPAVTFFVGENGSGKSTLVEAIAVAAILRDGDDAPVRELRDAWMTEEIPFLAADRP